MNALINDLKRDHEKLLSILQDAQNLGLGSEAGRKKLLEGKLLLTDHLRKEDTKLYPALSGNTAAAATANDFSKEMQGLTTDILNFMNRLNTAEINIEYAKELGRIISTVRMRIRREEIQLYPLFEKVTA